MTTAIKNLGEQAKQIRPKMFKYLASSVGIFVVLYLCFLAIIVNEAVSAKRDSRNLDIVRQEYQNLESEYFTISSKVDLDYAESLGFYDKSAKVKYAIRTTVSTVARK